MSIKRPSPENLFYDQPPTTKVENTAEQVEVDLSPRMVEKPIVEKKPIVVDEVVEHAVGNIIDLPSKGILGYPGSISHREIYAGDEEILKTATNKNFSRTLNRVLKSICNDADFYDDLYVGDRDYILTSIWANTYDSIKRFEVTCRHCGEKEEIEIDLFDLKDTPIKDNFKSRLSITIKKTGDVVTIRPVTVRDENNAELFMANNPKLEFSFEIVHCALSLEFGKPISIKDRVEYIKENVSAREMGVIKEYHRYFRFGLDTTFEHECGECSGVTHDSIPFRPEDFIAPDVRTDFEQLLHDN